MPSTRFAEAEAFADVAALPDDAAALFAEPADDLFASRAWYSTVLAHAVPPGAAARFVLCRSDGRPLALFPMQASGGGRGLQSLTTPYTCRYRPLLAANLEPAAMNAAIAAFARFCRGRATTRLDALPAEWPALDTCLAAMRAGGLVPRQFDHFGNWYEPVAERTSDQYLSARPGQLRETIRRKLRRADRDPTCRFKLITGGAELAEGIEAFEAVYRKSWKEPEPFPEFNAALMRAVAPFGLLRLGLLHVDDQPVAAQLWVMEAGRATVLKLAHDETFKQLSPGTVLTARMLRRLIDDDRASEIDFGRGDDDYKRGWVGLRRQRIGLLLINPWRPRGLAELGRHAVGRARAALRRGD